MTRNRLSQSVAIAIAGLFGLGFIISPVGVWTGAIMSAWFVGTQRAWRGFVLMTAIALLPGLAWHWHGSRLPAKEYVAWMTLAAASSIVPYSFYRATGLRLGGFLTTLSLPLWGVVFLALGQRWLPVSVFRVYAPFGIGAAALVVYWFAAEILWVWNHGWRDQRIAVGAGALGAACLLALDARFGAAFLWFALAGGLGSIGWALLQPDKRRQLWANKPARVASMRSPHTGEPLHMVSDRGQEALASPSGERFPIRHGIPMLLGPEDLTGSNLKYRHLYETIGGFYDDIQRVWCALNGVDRDEHFLRYTRLLEAKPGDSVLETSVGTGLNFKYLPRGAKLCGLDLSPEMLANCQINLRRWGMDADLLCGNAETLPFADESFDVVFHSGGINFFNDRAKAIREMIRVAKPGSLLLIADETEAHVKEVYEKMPGGLYKDRKEAVAAPVDLVPPEMQEVHVETLTEGRFYALTFRKPPAGARP